MVQLVDGAFCYRAGLAVDADGAHRAYHPDSRSGLDNLDNALRNPKVRDGRWVGVVCNDMGVPVVQGPSDPAPGFYVSPTSLCDRSRGQRDPLRYVDAETVPYVTTTRDMLRLGARLGDVGVVTYGAASCCVVVADAGPHPGEGSIALARELGIPSSPRNGGLSAPAVSYCVFRDSARGWPRSREDVSAAALAALERWGGFARLAEVLG